ncbi:MAG: glycosyltransferase family 39 protein [Patescibacteria group bacterium]
MPRLTRFLKENSLIILILLLAVGLRLAKIHEVPPSLNWDEISHGYNAYSILKTAKDEWGKTLPTIFRAYGDYKLPVYIYLTAISEFFLGLTAVAVRLPSVVAGIATIIFTYLLVKEIFEKKVALLSAFLVAIEPWSLFLSRGAFEANLSLPFIVGGFYFFLKSFRKPSFLILSSLFLGLSVWTYNSARVFVPLMLLAFILIYKKEIFVLVKKQKRNFIFSALVLALFFVPMFYQLVSPEGRARYGWVAILEEGAIAEINEARTTSTLSPVLSRLVNNKITYFSTRFAKNWLSHFSLSFLFLEGGSHYQFSVQGRGILYPAGLAFFLLGLIFLIRKKHKGSLVILSWLVLGPVASSLTREAPHVLRAISLLPAPMIATSLGFFSLLDWLGKRKLLTLRKTVFYTYLVVLFFSLENYLGVYLEEYRRDYSWSWQYGYKEAVSFIKENYGNYDKIIVTKKYGEPHEFILFFWPWEPGAYRNDPNLVRFFQSDWYWVDGFDKFHFVNEWDIPEKGERFILESKIEVNCEKGSCLLVTSPGNYPEEWKNLKTINFLNGEAAFEILEN